MRFQDAAPDARAVVYAGIQADPLVARAARAARRRRARAAGPRPGRDERRVDRRRRVAGDVPDAVRRRRRPAGAGRARSGARRSSRRRWRSPSAASRSAASSAGRSSKSLTERLLRAGDPGRPATAIRRERRILFDGVPRRDPPVRRHGRGGRAPRRRSTASGAPAASTPTSSTSSTTPGATPRTRTSGSAVVLVVFDAARSCAVRLDRQTAPHDGDAGRHDRGPRRPRVADGRDAMTPTDAVGPAARPRGPLPRPVRRGRPGRPPPDVGPDALRPGSRLAALDRARVRARLVRASAA